MKKNGIEYEMGANINEVKKGDAIKIGPGRLEVISSITPNPEGASKRFGNMTIATESGRTYTMMSVHSYGKKIEK